MFKVDLHFHGIGLAVCVCSHSYILPAHVVAFHAVPQV